MPTLTPGICGALWSVPKPDHRADPYTVAATVAFIKGLFHRRVILRPDQEEIVMDLARKVEAELPDRVVVRPAPQFSSQSNLSENANGILQAQFRTTRSALEARLGARVRPGSAMYKWLQRHAGWVATNLRIKASGRTAHEDVYGHAYTREMATPGESVLARLPRAKNRRARGKVYHKGDMGFAKAVWLGRSFDTDEHICALETGELITTRTVKRLPDERRFNRTAVAALAAMPWHRRGRGVAPRGVEPIVAPPAGAGVDLAAQEAADGQQGVPAAQTGPPDSGVAGPPAPGPAVPPSAPEGGVAPNPPTGSSGQLSAPQGQAPAVPEQQAGTASAGGGAPETPRAAAPSAGAPQTPQARSSPKRPAEDGGDGGGVSRHRVSGVAAEHCDDVRPDFLQILRDMDVPDPHDASESQHVPADRGLHTPSA